MLYLYNRFDFTLECRVKQARKRLFQERRQGLDAAYDTPGPFPGQFRFRMRPGSHHDPPDAGITGSLGINTHISDKHSLVPPGAEFMHNLDKDFGVRLDILKLIGAHNIIQGPIQLEMPDDDPGKALRPVGGNGKFIPFRA